MPLIISVNGIKDRVHPRPFFYCNFAENLPWVSSKSDSWWAMLPSERGAIDQMIPAWVKQSRCLPVYTASPITPELGQGVGYSYIFGSCHTVVISIKQDNDLKIANHTWHTLCSLSITRSVIHFPGGCPDPGRRTCFLLFMVISPTWVCPPFLCPGSTWGTNAEDTLMSSGHSSLLPGIEM